MRFLQISKPEELRKILQDIKVDAGGIKIMAPKALMYILRINSISNVTANILKQEMLSLGADVAVARGALTGKTKKTDCLLMGNLSQFNRLNQKLHRQPFGLDKLGEDLSSMLKNYQRDRFVLDLGRHKLNLGSRTFIMGIANLTPDSFSADGLYKSKINPSTTLRIDGERSRTINPSTTLGIDGERSRTIKNQKSKIMDFIEKMVEDGADIIDIGGESTHPGAKPVSLKEELARTIPVIKALARKIKVPISIDTYKPEVARLALDNGAVIVNDISGLRNPKMAKVVAKYKAAVVIMHMKGEPRTMQTNPVYKSLIDELVEYLDKAISEAIIAGIDREKIIIDPGIGFGKTLKHNLEILKSLGEFKVLGRPLLVGPSRKSFIGKILNLGPLMRIFGTVSSCVLAARAGANIVRVHDVKEVKEALKIFDAINNI